MNYKKGFTVIEIIVVVAIIAILSAVIMTNVNVYNKKSKEAATKAQLKQISQALLMYKVQYGCFPDPLNCSGSGINLTCPCCLNFSGSGCDDYQRENWDKIAQLLVNNKLIGDGKILRKDPWGNNYYYFTEWKDDLNNYCTVIYSYGSDNIDNGSGDCPWYHPTKDIGVTIDTHQ